MAAVKARKPKRQRGEYPTIAGNPPLGYLIHFYCPKCGAHLFSAYEEDLRTDREDGYIFKVAKDWNYCSRCGTLLDLDEWKHREPPAAVGDDIEWEE